MEIKKTNFNELTDQEIRDINGGFIDPMTDYSRGAEAWVKFWEGVGMKLYDATHNG